MGRCPLCGNISIERYAPPKKRGKKLARSAACEKVREVSADFLATENISDRFLCVYAVKTSLVTEGRPHQRRDFLGSRLLYGAAASGTNPLA